MISWKEAEHGLIPGSRSWADSCHDLSLDVMSREGREGERGGDLSGEEREVDLSGRKRG
jgi:hypothetical protein